MNTFRFHCNPNNYTDPLDPNNHINQVIVCMDYKPGKMVIQNI
jgi:hypothetical protein